MINLSHVLLYLCLRMRYSVLYSLYDYQNNSEAFSSRYKLDATTIKSVKQVARSSNNSAMRRGPSLRNMLSFAVSFQAVQAESLGGLMARLSRRGLG